MAGPSFYNNDKVVPLDRERHRTLKLRTDRGVRFAAHTHFVPIAAGEFYEAARDYPIVFSGGDDLTPAAILGLRTDENLFVDAQGRWAEWTYVPILVRRYPFILTGGASEQGPAQYTVCLDESYDGLSETEGTPLFDEEGKESEATNQMITLLRTFLAETQRSRRFVERLSELGLLKVQSIRVEDGIGRKFALQDFRMVDEQKLKELDSEVLAELNRAGYLGCIYAHLISLGNATRLTSRLSAEETGAAAANAPGSTA